MAPSKPIPESIKQEGQSSPVQAYTPIQLHLLERLAQLVQRRKELAGEAASQDGRFFLPLVQRGIFAAYVDCLEEGIGEEALEILREESLAAAA